MGAECTGNSVFFFLKSYAREKSKRISGFSRKSQEKLVFNLSPENVVAYLLHAWTVESQKHSLLSNTRTQQ
jgi:hypothetical protein